MMERKVAQVRGREHERVHERRAQVRLDEVEDGDVHALRYPNRAPPGHRPSASSPTRRDRSPVHPASTSS